MSLGAEQDYSYYAPCGDQDYTRTFGHVWNRFLSVYQHGDLQLSLEPIFIYLTEKVGSVDVSMIVQRNSSSHRSTRLFIDRGKRAKKELHIVRGIQGQNRGSRPVAGSKYGITPTAYTKYKGLAPKQSLYWTLKTCNSLFARLFGW